MIQLKKYLSHPMRIDGHFHDCDLEDDMFVKRVVFADVDPDHIYAKGYYMDYYDRWYTRGFGKDIILATSNEPTEMINIRERYKQSIRGYGEIKCYENSKDRMFGLKLRDFQELFDYNTKDNLPIYIHYTLRDDLKMYELKEVLSNYPNTPLVLCHFGMGDKDLPDSSREEIAKRTLQLLKEYNNLYTDITFDALDYLVHRKDLLNNIPKDRVILGTDINQRAVEVLSKEEIDDIYKNIRVLSHTFNSDQVIKKLFK